MARIRLLLAIIVISLLAAVVPSLATAAAERVNIGYVMVMDDAPAMVAKEAGYYEAKGLQPNLLEAIKTQTFHWAINDAQIQRMKEIAKIMEEQGALDKPVDVNAALELSWQKQAGR